MQRFSVPYNLRDLSRTLALCLALVCGCCAFAGFLPASAHAQGTAQMVITGIPPVLPSPYISDLERSYAQGFFTSQFIYVSPSRQPQTFRFNLTLEVNGETLIDVTSESNTYTPGIHVYRTLDDDPAITFPLGYGDLVDLLGARVDQNGLLPEGDYVLRIEPVVADEFALIPTVPGMAFFTVRYAEPPLLLSPFDTENLTTQFPIFSWTPVTGAPLTSAFEYEFTLVEVLPGQAPYQALESNIPHAQAVLVGQTSFLYTLEELPLEEGKLYAWQTRARDVNEQMPVLQRGDSEYYTFTVGQEGLGSMITSWSFPVSAPFIIYKFKEDAALDPADTEIFIDGELPIELRGVASEARFDRLLIDAETQSIIEGSLTIPDAIALEVAINPLTDDFSGYTAVAPGAALTLQEGLLLDLGNNVTIDAAGLHPRGTHNARIAYTGLEGNAWTATYSDNFTFGLAPFGITSGRVDFAADGIARAYADASGFHLIDQGDPVIAQIPDRLQLPDEQVAFISLKRAGASLVDIEPAGRNQFSIREKSGMPLELTLAGLDPGPMAQHPQFVATLDEVVIDARTGQLVSGQVTAEAASGATVTLDHMGIPIAPTSFVTRKTPGGLTTKIEGAFTLFGRPVENADPVTFTLREDGVVEGTVDLDGEAYAFLDGPTGQVSIDISSASGSIHVPLNAFTPPAIHIDVAGAFSINRGDDIVASARIGFTYTGEGAVPLSTFATIDSRRANTAIDLDGFALEIDEISSLSLFYTAASGLTYTAPLQARLLPFDDAPVSIPLQGVELQQNSFYFPAQEGHGDLPGFPSLSRDIGVATLDLLAYRIPAVTVDRNGGPAGRTLSPMFDFEVHLDGLAHMPADISRLPLTLQDARIERGVVTGDILPYTPATNDLRMPMQYGTLQVARLAGKLGARNEQQDLEISAYGPLTLYSPVANNFESCLVPEVSVTIDAAGVLSGASPAFEPCTEYSIGPLFARFEEATLSIVTKNERPHFILAGEVDGFSRTGSRRRTDASGMLTLDISRGEVLEADIDAADVFLEFPVAAPQFQINLEETHLSVEGFTVPADSTVINAVASDDALRLLPRGNFLLGLRPAQTNTGSADLLASGDAEQRIAYLDADGFHLERVDPDVASVLPQRIALPGAFGAYIDVLQSGDGVEMEPDSRQIKTKTDATAQLVIPQVETARGPLQLPIAFDLQLDAALGFAAGEIAHSFDSRPVQPFGADSPVYITGVTYADSALQLQARIRPPAFFADQQDDLAALETTFRLQADGLAATGFAARSFSLYGDMLTLNVDRAELLHEDAMSFKLGGYIDSPLFKHEAASRSPLQFEAVFDAANNGWQLAARSPATRSIAVDKARLLLDPLKPARLHADPQPILELNGLLAMPAAISDAFALEISIEIGPGGVYVWHTGALEAPQPFFGGFLAAHLDALDIYFDSERQTLVTTIDGAFEPVIMQSANTSFGDEPADLLPFSGIELATDGSATLGGYFGIADSAAAFSLLGDLPRMAVISQHFWIEDLVLRTPGQGLLLDLEGSVRLPTPEGRRLPVGHQTNGATTRLVFSDRIPVAFTLDSAGAPLDAAGNPWQPLLSSNYTPADSAGSRNGEDPHNFAITSVLMHFNPRVASDNRIFTTARLALPAQPVTPADSSRQAGSLQPEPAATARHIALGNARTPARNPGLIIEQQRPQQYLLGDLALGKQTPPLLENALFGTRVRSVSLPDPTQLQLEMAGIGTHKAGAFQGFFPIEGILLTPQGLQHPGQAAGPSAFSFAQAGIFETGCLDFGFSERAPSTDEVSGPGDMETAPAVTQARLQERLTRLQFGASCGDSLRLTLTDKYLGGSFANLILRNNGGEATNVLLTSAQIGIAGIGELAANLSYDAGPASPALLIEGLTSFRNVSVESSGSLTVAGDTPHLSVAFNPTPEPLALLEGGIRASIVGGGLFLNPTAADLDLITLVLNERSNNGFSPNRPSPASNPLGEGQLGLLLPLEVQFGSVGDTLAMQGTGLMTAGEHFTTLDIDGTFLNRPDELGTGLFLAETRRPDAAPTLEGLANISLNYTPVAGGIVKANFLANTLQEAAASADSSFSWSIYGRSDIDVAGVTRLPGKVMLTRDGLLLDLYNTARISTGQISLQNDLNLTLWSNQGHNGLEGYAAFDAGYELIPGYILSTVKMYGSIIEDREAPLFYAARNFFADVPFVYTGPIDPWLSFEDGSVYGGDARNTTFRRMITDARQFGNAMPDYANVATAALRNALDVQSMLSSNLPFAGNLPYFSLGDSVLMDTGAALLALESSKIEADRLPGILETLVEELYNDIGRPQYQRYNNVPASNPRTLAALQNMRNGVTNARRSGERDLFSLGSLLPRPLLWNSDYVELSPDLATSPLTTLTWPGANTTSRPGFAIDSTLQAVQAGSLLDFKGSNEGLDIQFLRTIGAVELNMVNLKISRTPNQAVDFTRATAGIARYYANNIASDWELLGWTRNRSNWLQQQEDAVIRSIRDNLRTYNGLENSLDAIREITAERYDLVRDLSLDTDWERGDLPEDQRYAQYLETLDEASLKAEFEVTAKDLWYDVPMAALSALSDTLASLIEHKNERFEAGMDTLSKAYDAFTLALDPLYDIQTSFTTSLYGMAEEYSNWRASIRRLDPEAVNYAFQFLPYRGNYRILAEDLIPPTIEAIRITPQSNRFLNNTTISWTAAHPVEVAESSISLTVDGEEGPRFASVAKADSLDFYTVKPDAQTRTREVDVTLRVRGAGGIPAVKKGQFSVPVDPDSEITDAPAGTPLIPGDSTPPPEPRLRDLQYSSYFSDTPNTLKFEIAPLDDPESGLELIEYRILNDRDDEEVLQDWTALQKSTSYFAGRLVETSLPIQGEDVTVRVVVRARNEAGLTSESSSTLSFRLDNTSPRASIAGAAYFNAFDVKHPLSVELELGDIADEESGIDLIEYALQFSAQSALSNANWQPLLSFPERDRRAGNRSVFIDLSEENLPENRFTLTLYLRVTNGAGLQSIVNQVIDIPGRDVSPPSEPQLALEHSGFYGPLQANQLRIILSGSQDLESGIASVEYRIIDGQTGTDIVGWEPFVFLDPDNPTFILPATDKVVSLPAFSSSRSVIVETRTTNAAGLISNKGVRFIQLVIDDTAPTAPALDLVYQQGAAPSQNQLIRVEVGESQDLESHIDEVSYRIVNRETRDAITPWRPLVTLEQPLPRFPGVTASIETSGIPAGVKPGLQVRIGNLQGLQTIVAEDLGLSEDDTPPLAPALLLETLAAEDPTAPTTLNIYLGASHDPESGLARIRYRVRDLQHADSTIIDWTHVSLSHGATAFAGRNIRTTIPPLGDGSAYLVETELVNAAGLATRVAGIVDQDTQLASNTRAPARPAVSLFHFGSENSIRDNALEVHIQPDTDLLTRIDSVYYRHTLFDGQGEPITGRGLSTWRAMAYRTSSPGAPLRTYLQLPDATGVTRTRVEVRLVNENGSSPPAQATATITTAEDETPPSRPRVDYNYSGYHNETATNQLRLQVDRVSDPESRIAEVAYRIVNRQNTDDVVVDWTAIDGVSAAGVFQPADVAITLPAFNRDRALNIEVRATNGAGLATRVDTLLDIMVDRTPPEILEPALVIAGLNDARFTPSLTVYPGLLEDEGSQIAQVAYRIFASSDSAGAIVDWTPININKGHSVRIPAIRTDLPPDALNSALTFELTATNEAGLEASIEADIRADLDNSAPQMPRVEVAYRESDIGTGYLFIEPGAFRDAESNIASLAYRLVDSQAPDFVLMDWVSIPVPRDIRVSVAPIAIPRSEIPYDGAVQLAVEFRATNGAGLFSVRRSTIDLPGDESPPDSPSLLVAHRNAYDPLHPNTVEIQIGSSADDQSAIARAQYRITNASTGEELASWTQLPLAADGYFPGTILFEELPVIRNSTSLLVEVEVHNTAGLINKITEHVQVDVQNDGTPPLANISLHYFANELALVLDQLADPESKIQKVEYRFLDNVDQSELTGWADLFEIATPQDRYPRQSFKVQQPAVQSGRTLKVEVRVTNGAGLQTTVSKTVLVRSAN